MRTTPAHKTGTGPGKPPDGAGTALPRRGRWECLAGTSRRVQRHTSGRLGHAPWSAARALFMILVVAVWGAIRERDVNGI